MGARSRRSGVLLAVVAGVIAAAAITYAIVERPFAPADTSAPRASHLGDVGADPQRLTLTDDMDVVVIGDSWTFGEAATHAEGGYAHVLGAISGWQMDVQGASGSGYLRDGIGGPSFPERAQRFAHDGGVDLVIVQGSLNDQDEVRVPSAAHLAKFDEAVLRTWDRLAAAYPNAAIVVFGPAQNLLPTSDPLTTIDTQLSDLAAQRSLWYISPIREAWITPSNYDQVIDSSLTGAFHPSDEGHAYLAERLLAALEGRSTTPTAASTSGR